MLLKCCWLMCHALGCQTTKWWRFDSLTYGETNKLQNKISSWSAIVSKYTVACGSPLCFACCHSVHEVIEFVQKENRTTRALLTSVGAARIFKWMRRSRNGESGSISARWEYWARVIEVSIQLSSNFIDSRCNENPHWAQAVSLVRFHIHFALCSSLYPILPLRDPLLSYIPRYRNELQSFQSRTRVWLKLRKPFPSPKTSP